MTKLLPKSYVTDLKTLTNDTMAMTARENNPNAVESLRWYISQIMNNHGLFMHHFRGKFTKYPADWVGYGFDITTVGEYYGSEDPYCPYPNWTDRKVWFNVITMGIANRTTQIAIYGFGGDFNSTTFIRNQHDINVSKWNQLQFK